MDQTSRLLTGYAAIFDVPDNGGDIIRKGAFARAAKAGLPLLWEHDQRRRIGFVEILREDDQGLHVTAVIDDGDVEVRSCNGLSFGYRVRAMNKQKFRELIEVELIEISLVRAPMQPLAKILTICKTGDQ